MKLVTLALASAFALSSTVALAHANPNHHRSGVGTHHRLRKASIPPNERFRHREHCHVILIFRESQRAARLDEVAGFAGIRVEICSFRLFDEPSMAKMVVIRLLRRQPPHCGSIP